MCETPSREKANAKSFTLIICHINRLNMLSKLIQHFFRVKKMLQEINTPMRI